MQAQHAGKYLSAKSYWMNHNHFVREVEKKPGNFKRGMIMGVKYGSETFHLEVITSGMVAQEYLGGLVSFGDPITFRSRGGGRRAGEDGVEKSGGQERSLTDSRVKLFRLTH